MKRSLTKISCICLGIILIAVLCIITNSSVTKDDHKEALSNCMEYIHNSQYTDDFVENINTKYVSIESLSDDLKETVWVAVEGMPNWDKEYWVFTIGDTSSHYYTRIVCEKDTNSVIGHIPTL